MNNQITVKHVIWSLFLLGLSSCSMDPKLEDLKLSVGFNEKESFSIQTDRPGIRNLINQHCCFIEYFTDQGIAGLGSTPYAPVKKANSVAEFIVGIPETFPVGAQFSFTLYCALVTGGVASSSEVSQNDCVTNVDVGTRESAATGWFIIRSKGLYECQVPSGQCT